ncbi:hypothetical protein BsWGS_22971 [Bradybaena similaris]
MNFLLHLACLVLAVASSAAELSQTLQQFYCAYNGDYNNLESIQDNPDSGVVPVELRVLSFYNPALSDKPLTYMEQKINGVIVRVEIGNISQVGDNGIRADPYNITGYSPKQSGPINIEDLKSLTKDQLQENPGCSGFLTRTKDYEFSGMLPDDKHANKFQVHRDYSARVLCDEIDVVVPLGAAEGAGGSQYTLTRTGGKYPTPGSSFTCNCSSTSP